MNITEYVTELNKSIEEFNKIWKYLIGKDEYVTQLNKLGRNWKDLSLKDLDTIINHYNNLKNNRACIKK